MFFCHIRDLQKWRMSRNFRLSKRKLPFLVGVPDGITNHLLLRRQMPVIKTRHLDEETNETGKIKNDRKVVTIHKTADYSFVEKEKPTSNIWHNLNTNAISYNVRYLKVILEVFKILHKTKEKYGTPGLSFAISHNGNLVMKGGIGLADVENHVHCTSKSVTRIGSISKSLTAIAVGKLLEKGLLDLHAPIQEYVPSFPYKTFNGEEARITIKQILSHTSGIRGYLNNTKTDSHDEREKRKVEMALQKYGSQGLSTDEKYIREHFETVEDGLALFRDDPLLSKPGTRYEYSSLAYSLISRAIETVSGKDYVAYMKELCNEIGLKDTRVELNNPIIYNRARNYMRVNGCLENVPYVNNSYKWSGGGFLSNVEDLLRFGNTMLISAQTNQGVLKPSTMSTLWEPVAITQGHVDKKIINTVNTLGFRELLDDENGGRAIFHTGGAVGASSILYLHMNNRNCTPKKEKAESGISHEGTVISLILNIINVKLQPTVFKIQECFCEHDSMIMSKCKKQRAYTKTL